MARRPLPSRSGASRAQQGDVLGPDGQAGLLGEFADHGLLQGLPGFDGSAGQFEGAVTVAAEEHAPVAEDDGADADGRVRCGRPCGAGPAGDACATVREAPGADELLHDGDALVGVVQEVDGLDAEAVLDEQVLPQPGRQDPHPDGQRRIVPEPDRLLAWRDRRGRAVAVQVGVEEREDQRCAGAQAGAQCGQDAVRVDEGEAVDGVRGVEGGGGAQVVDDVARHEPDAGNVRVGADGTLVLGG
ncbi:hypothetical protein SGRIM128S_08903 [Streptomyces griseomycini]